VSKPDVKILTAAEIQQMLDVSPFNLFLGLEVIKADPATQEVTMRSPMRPEFERGRAPSNGMAASLPRSSTQSAISPSA
jgi:hypothetical protein